MVPQASAHASKDDRHKCKHASYNASGRKASCGLVATAAPPWSPDLLPQLCRPLSVVPSRPLLLCVLCLRHLQLLSLFWPPGKKSGCAEILVAELHCSGEAGGCRKLCELVSHRTRAAAAAAAAARRQQLSSPGELHSQLNLSSVSHRQCLNQATCTTWLPRPALDLPPCKSH